ncbi:hypothetical protein LTS18_012554, partial [Coniosporium uncinatum]
MAPKHKLDLLARFRGQHEKSKDYINGESDLNADTENDGEDAKPQAVGFWHPALKPVRNEAMLKWLLTTVVLMAFILSVLTIYWGVFFHLPKNIASLVVYVVNFDGQVAPYTNGPDPFVGRTITELAVRMVKSPTATLGFGVLPASQFKNDPMLVRQAVYEWDAWAAVIINPNATALLYDAVQNGNSSYDPMGACQLIYQSARDDTNWYDFMQPILSMFMTEATTMVGRQWASQILQQASNNPSLLAGMQAAPQALSPAIGFSQYDLRPFYPYTTIPAVSIGLIYLIIISFFSFSFYLPIHLKYLSPQDHPPLKFPQLVLWRWLTTISAYFFLSLAYSLISLALQINFSGVDYPLSDTTPAIA